MTMRRSALIIILGLLAGAGAPASAEVSEATRAERWAELAATIFGDRKIEDGSGVIDIDAPARAADAALVPVTIRVTAPLPQRVAQIYFVIDDNPSPLAGRFTFGPAADPREIGVRVRVDDYTYLHAVAETEDGRLYGVARFIKAAGGCSAPAGQDPALAQQRLGQMKMTMNGAAHAGTPLEAHLLVSHPNSSGMQMDQVTRNYVPADFIRSVRVSYNGAPVLSVESDISMSEDPSFTFAFLPREGEGSIDVAVEDSSNRHFERAWPVTAEPGS
jgi:sulfur-oxidizing protein SoxY